MVILELIHAKNSDFGRSVFIRYKTIVFGLLGDS